MDAERGIDMLQLYIEIVILFLLISTGYWALKVKDLLAAIILFSAFSLFAVLIYLLMSAPDVAFTEAVIGTISTVYFVTALRKLTRGVK